MAPDAHRSLVECLRQQEAAQLTSDERARVKALSTEIQGWSGERHYVFFKALLRNVPFQSLLMLGVYNGRDIAFLQDLRQRCHPGRELRITGVDRFDDKPCADWPQESHGRSWEEAGFGPPPSLAMAQGNLMRLELDQGVRLLQADDERFLEAVAEQFDVIYLDTSHDYDTVRRQCRQVGRVCARDAILCGDDYSDRGTWGVASAVHDSFTEHEVFGGIIWVASRSRLREDDEETAVPSGSSSSSPVA